MNSISVISRAYDAEAPYIKSFIEHYTKIGCSEFHIVVPKGNPYKYLEKECKKYNQVKLYIDYNDDTPLRGSQSIPLPYIKTSHIISVDIDEYLNVQDITPLLEHEYVRLNWVIAPYTQVSNAKRIPGFIDRQCKYIVKTSLCESMDDHDCKLNKQVPQYELENKLIHYVYRSFNDLYLKCSMSNYGDYQASTEGNLLEGLADSKKLPQKFKMAAIYQRIANASQSYYPILYKIDIEIEKKLVINSSHYNKIEKFQYALLHYTSRIELSNLIKEMLKHEKYRLYSRIPHHLLATLSDSTLIDKLAPQQWIQNSSSSIYKKLIFKVRNNLICKIKKINNSI